MDVIHLSRTRMRCELLGRLAENWAREHGESSPLLCTHSIPRELGDIDSVATHLRTNGVRYTYIFVPHSSEGFQLAGFCSLVPFFHLKLFWRYLLILPSLVLANVGSLLQGTNATS